MKKTDEELSEEIQQHVEKVEALFKEGLEIHDAYQAAPDEHDLTKEATAFLEKDREGTDELQQGIALQKELIERRSEKIAESQKDL